MQTARRLSLNTAQKKVVEHKGGPLLVVAGAGTGKTRVIVEHINRLLHSGVNQKEILALTFTEKAATEMLDRLTETRGEFDLDIPIMTFNAYGESLLRRYSTDIGLPRNFLLLGENARVVFMREHLDELGLDYHAPIGDPGDLLGEIASYFSKLKQHAITANVYKSFAAQMPSNDDAEKLDRQKHTELAHAFEAYLRLCRSHHVIDYDDQIYLVIELLSNRPNIREELRKSYHTIMVDEFQDTNLMQSELIDMLVNVNKNLIVVGDDDQSIYGFRGATLKNILEFKNRYPKASEITLIQNYRSGQKILDAAYKLIGHNNPNRLEAVLQIDKKLTAETAGVEPTIQKFTTYADELAWIAEDIKSSINAGADPGEIAVLARGNETAGQIAEALNLADIPNVVIGHRYNVYQEPVVRMVIETLRAIADPENSSALYHTLTSDFFNISPNLLVALNVQSKKTHDPLTEIILATDESELHDARQAVALIGSWRASSGLSNIRSLAYSIIKDSGFIDRAQSAMINTEQEVKMTVVFNRLNHYFQILKEFEKIAIWPSVHAYLEALPALRAASETNEDETLDLSNRAVSVLTVHKAKGLEWNTVYIANCAEQSFPYLGGSRGIALPEGLLNDVSDADDTLAEERRLMYVAVTRARKILKFSFAEHHHSESTRRPSRFLKEMFREDAISRIPLQPEHVVMLENLNDIPNRGDQIPIPRAILSDDGSVKISPSQIDTFLRCRYDFFHRFVLHVPDEPSVTLERGSILHAQFEAINRGKQTGQLPALADLVRDLTQSYPQSGFGSKAQYEKSLKVSIETLSTFYEQHAHENYPILAVEEKFRLRLDDGKVTVSGTYDVVFEQEGHVAIRDYKTGHTVRNEKQAKDRASNSTQLTIYALAWQKLHDEMPKTVSLEFVDTKMVGSVHKRAQSLQTIEQKIIEIADDIRKRNFTPKPGTKHDYCHHPPLGE